MHALFWMNTWHGSGLVITCIMTSVTVCGGEKYHARELRRWIIHYRDNIQGQEEDDGVK